VWRNLVAGVDRAIGTDAGTARGEVARDAPEARQEVVLGILGIDAELHRIAAAGDVLLPVTQGQAGRHAQLLLHDVDPGDHLSDWMLNLKTCVHLHEIEGSVVVHQEFDGARVLIVDCPCGGHRGLAHVGALCLGQLRRGSDLDEFLVPALDRTVALEQVGDIAVTVAEDLNLDVARIDDRLFQEDLGAAEGAGRLGAYAVEVAAQTLGVGAQPDAAPAAAIGGLQHHRIAHLLGNGQGGLDVLEVALRSRDDRHAGRDHRRTGGHLVAHAADHRRRGPTKRMPRAAQAAAKSAFSDRKP
jgi:hypothetical protein